MLSGVSARAKQNNEIRAWHGGAAQETVAGAILSRPEFGSQHSSRQDSAPGAGECSGVAGDRQPRALGP